METQILKPTKENIALACELLKLGEIVAVPTETVYGLAGDSTKGEVVNNIFIAKGRPNDNPLIVHISNMKMLEGIVSFVSEDSKKLAEAFWPGPLTMVMPKGENVCSETTAGLNSVGVRMPNHEVALEIIERSGVAFAAPSANLSGKPSPTKAIDVYEDMKGKIPLIIDGGECQAGVESTVVSMLNDKPVILRPGVITKEDIEMVLGKEVIIAKEVLIGVTDEKQVLSPGMKYKHYSPKAEVIIVRGDIEVFSKFVNKINEKDAYAMCFDGEEDQINMKSISYGSRDNPKEQAHNLFSVLRKFDELGASKVFVRCPNEDGISLAVYNRLIRSAGFRIINL